MLYLDEFAREHDFSDKSVMICAPAPNLVLDLYEAPKVDYIIGLNHHTLILKPDFIVALDRHTMELLQDYRGLVMAKHDDADIHIGLCPSFGFSGPCAVWVADYLNFKEIVLAGFDCYLNNKRSYWHDDTLQKPHLKTTEEQQKIIWEQVLASLRRPEMVKVLSGTLVEVLE